MINAQEHPPVFGLVPGYHAYDSREWANAAEAAAAAPGAVIRFSDQREAARFAAIRPGYVVDFVYHTMPESPSGLKTWSIRTHG